MKKSSFVIFVTLMLFVVACGKNKQEQVSLLKKEAGLLFDNGQYSKAIDILKEALVIDSQNLQLYINIGNANLHLLNYNGALKSYEQALSMSEESIDLLLKIGKVHFLRSDYKEAEKVANKIKSRGNESAELLIFLGDLLFLKTNFSAAEKQYRNAVAMEASSGMAMIKLVTCLHVQGKKEDAQDFYDKLIALGQHSGTLLEQIGSYWKLAGDNKKAEMFYLKACELEPKNISYQLRLAEFYHDSEKYEKVLSILKPLEDKIKDSINSRLLMVETLIALKYLDQAGAYLEELMEEKPNDINIQLLSGKNHLMSNKPAVAITHFEFVINQEPDMVLAHYLLGVAYLTAGHNKIGHQQLVKALSMDNKYTDAELALADYYYKKNDFEIALEHVKRIAEREPHNYRAQHIMGNIFLAQGKYDQALKCFQRAQKIKPGDLSPVYYAAVATEMAGEVGKAKKLYHDIMKKRPEMFDVKIRLAQLLVKQGSAQVAKKYFLEEIKKGSDDSGFVEYILGKICIALDDSDSAKKYYEASIAKNNENTSAYIELARLYNSIGEYLKGFNTLESAIEKNNHSPDIYLALASTYYSKGEYEKTINVLVEALKNNPDHPMISNNLAALYLDKGENINKAFDLAQSAFQRMEKEACVNDTLGWAYYRKGFLNQAEWYVREAMKIVGSKTENMNTKSIHAKDFKQNMELAIIHYHLGVVLKDKGDETEARMHFKKSLNKGLSGKYRKIVESII